MWQCSSCPLWSRRRRRQARPRPTEVLAFQRSALVGSKQARRSALSKALTSQGFSHELGVLLMHDPKPSHTALMRDTPSMQPLAGLDHCPLRWHVTTGGLVYLCGAVMRAAHCASALGWAGAAAAGGVRAIGVC
jgi:hypothetical protein